MVTTATGLRVRHFTLRNARIDGALLTGRKVYAGGASDPLEGVFINRTTFDSSTEPGLTTFGLGGYRRRREGFRRYLRQTLLSIETLAVGRVRRLLRAATQKETKPEKDRASNDRFHRRQGHGRDVPRCVSLSRRERNHDDHPAEREENSSEAHQTFSNVRPHLFPLNGCFD